MKSDNKNIEWKNPKVELPEKDGAYICTNKWLEEDDWDVDILEYGKPAPNANCGHTEGRIFQNGKCFGQKWDDGIDNVVIVKAWAYVPEPCSEDW